MEYLRNEPPAGISSQMVLDRLSRANPCNVDILGFTPTGVLYADDRGRAILPYDALNLRAGTRPASGPRRDPSE